MSARQVTGSMKKYLLRNRVRNSILLAILLQSIVFGIGLAVSGTFTGTTSRPYKVMESQAADKNSLISNYMNNALLLANTMEKEMGRLSEVGEIHDRLIDNLNHISAADGVFYLDLDLKQSVFYTDSEPQVYSSAQGDISCTIGNTETKYSIALSKNWRPKLTPGEWEAAEAYWGEKSGGNRWFFHGDRLYYILTQEAEGSRRIMGFEISSTMLDTYLKLDNPPYKGMQMLLLSDTGVLYSCDKEFGPDIRRYELDPEKGRLRLENGDIEYDGVFGALQIYGHIDQGPVYLGAVCYHSELAEISFSTILMIAGVYLISIVIAIIFSYIAIWMVLKPIQKLQADIACQKPEEVHFEDTGVVEIDRVHQALNDMAARLEESYSRYSFAMESAGDHVGSFEYQEEVGKVKVSPSIMRLLDIPEGDMENDCTMAYDKWLGRLEALNRIGELEGGYSFTHRDGRIRAVSIRQRDEAHGVFGMVIDKTDAYQEILRLKDISQHDQLTNLYNSSFLKKEGQILLDANRRRVNALVFCDLDNLKYVNDNYGHGMGDRYLKAMADLLLDMAKGERCIAVRLSGDEFVLFFYGYDDRKTIENKIREKYDQRPSLILPDGTSRRINASIGLAFAQRDSESIEDLLKRADRAMYRVKRNAKNGIAVYEKADGV